MNMSLKLFVSQTHKPRKPLIEEIDETFTAISLRYRKMKESLFYIKLM